MSTLPEYNVTGIDYADRRHLHYQGPIIDFHAHVMITRPGATAARRTQRWRAAQRVSGQRAPARTHW